MILVIIVFFLLFFFLFNSFGLFLGFLKGNFGKLASLAATL